MNACGENREKLVSLLLDAGADVNKGVLVTKVYHGGLAAGTGVQFTRTPYHVAEDKGHHRIMALLRSKGGGN